MVLLLQFRKGYILEMQCSPNNQNSCWFSIVLNWFFHTTYMDFAISVYLLTYIVIYPYIIQLLLY